MRHGPFLLWYNLVVVVAGTGLLLVPGLEAPRSWMLFALMLATIGGGTHFLVRSHPGYRFYLRTPPTFFSWVPPLALALGGTLFTLQLLGGFLTRVGMAVTAIAVALAVYCQVALTEPGRDGPAYARLVTNLSIYLAAFLLFVALQSSGMGQPQGAVLLGGLSGVLALELFREGRERPWREGVYALVLALLLAEVSWVLTLLPVGKVITGLVLLLTFYFVSGLIHHHLMDRLSPWIALEFSAVTAIGLGFLYGFQMAGG